MQVGGSAGTLSPVGVGIAGAAIVAGTAMSISGVQDIVAGVDAIVSACTGDGNEPASEKTAKNMAKQIERDLGKDARREFHDMKSGGKDRTLNELKQHAKWLYEEAGKPIPKWMQ